MSTPATSQIVQSMQHLTLGKVRLREQLERLEAQRLAFIEQGNSQYYAFLKEDLETKLGMCTTLLSGYYLLV